MAQKKLSTASHLIFYQCLFLAAQIKANDKGFLSTDITVSNMVSHRGDIHHLFPKEYLKANGAERSEYNQIANFVYAQQEINIKIGKKAPKEYMQEMLEQTRGGVLKYGGIVSTSDLSENLRQNCIPENFENMEFVNYDEFLKARRILMAKKIKDFYLGI